MRQTCPVTAHESRPSAPSPSLAAEEAGSTADAGSGADAAPGAVTPYVELDRARWRSLAATAPLPLTQADVEKLRGLGDPIDLAEVDVVYRPLTALLQDYVAATRDRAARTARFLGVEEAPTPFIIAVAGSVAVGKSTTARLIAHLLARFPETPRVSLVTTDGFLLPNAVLEERGLTARKGFPESYDRRALLDFVAAVKSGSARVEAPVYSHKVYDVVPGETIAIEHPDILVLEGLNVLQPAPRGRSGAEGPGAARDGSAPAAGGASALAVSDFVDFSIYVDAAAQDIRRWYLDRFLTLKHTAFEDPESYFQRYAQLPDDVAIAAAGEIWESVNLVNLRENIVPTRGRATLVLRKDARHHMTTVLLRKG